jgi:CRISPR-associated protein Cas2
MFVIVVYDISTKRVSKVMKICRKYLTHVQKSVFEGMLTLGKLEHMKGELQSVLVPSEDKILIYKLDSLRYTSKEEMGVHPVQDHIL